MKSYGNYENQFEKKITILIYSYTVYQLICKIT